MIAEQHERAALERWARMHIADREIKTRTPEGHLSAEVEQAVGMLSVQLDCSIPEAAARFEDAARHASVRYNALAQAIIDRAVTFEK